MTTITRIADSCLLIATDAGSILTDPGVFAFGWDGIDLESIGDIQHVLITHEHHDHVHPDFVRWIVDRGEDVSVHGNDNVVELLGEAGIEATNVAPGGTSYEDVVHETIPTGAAPPNRAWTIDGVLTHPGDSYQPTSSAPVLALPMIAPWGSTTLSVAFAKKLRPRMVVGVHDFYLSGAGRTWVHKMAGSVLTAEGIEVVQLEPGASLTV